ncbi:YhdB family protein [Virgibacillus sp. 179-BFC.A HS]|uniref:YhdB family protein n=1 Tax=Tigheibacillus jepli TaxID=3035914 RepID=A0ABU5CIV6_9BACI|nr:YhdB family protein [Virgibacillus sp. 179-BFC.A HS]MDY0406281.1 YhdB family protein [Virgibacillus sp. 179-BFC.A HS]
MDQLDYDKALYYMLWGQWDDLLVLMVRTRDDLLSKKIQHFLQAFHYSSDETQVIAAHDNLLYYIDHAMKTVPEAVALNM